MVFDPRKTSFETLLRLFWEGHDPTQGTRQGDDVGRSTARSSTGPRTRSGERPRLHATPIGARLAAAGLGAITTEIARAPEFHYAEEAQQQYLAKNPGGYGGVEWNGDPLPHRMTACC